MGSLPNHKVPVIDFTNANLKPGTDTWLSTGKEVLDALQEHGCFLAEYNKVPLDLRKDLFRVMEELFDLPLETKRRSVSDLPYYGYMGKLESGRDIYEAFGIIETTSEGFQDFTTTLWPQGNDYFRKKVYSFAKLGVELEQIVMRMVFENYGLDSYENHQQEVKYPFRMTKYRAPEEHEDNLGADVHTDKSFLTVLHQNHVNGLKVKTKDGHWIGIEMSRPSSFLVMAGEAIRAWSNGRIMAPIHKVMMNDGETRYSVIVFSHGKGIIKVPDKLIDEKHPLKFKPFDNFEFMRYYSTPEGRAQECALTAFCGI